MHRRVARDRSTIGIERSGICIYLGQHAHRFSEGWLKKATMFRMFFTMSWQTLTEGEEVRQWSVSKAQIVRRETPSMIQVAMKSRKRERQDTPDDRIVEDRDVVADSDQASFAKTIVLSRLEQVKKARQSMDLCSVESIQGYATDGMDS